MTIVVLEYLTSAPRRVLGAAADLEAEGRAMRDAVVADLLALPRASVTLLHRRGCAPAPRARLRAVEVRGDPERALRSAAARARFGLVIAPEPDGALERLTRALEGAGAALLGPSSAVVRLAADKLATARRLAAAGVPTPATETVRFARARAALERRVPPFVLKPRDGCGSAGVVLVRRRAGLDAALARVRAATTRPDFLAQEYVEGAHASVAVIAGADRIVPLGLCRQRLDRRGGAFLYQGGSAPWDHPGARRAVATACRAVAALGEAAGPVRGYLGIDLVIAGDAVRIIEINPRLTTSYVGLRRVLAINPARLMRDAALGGALPARVGLRGRCRFRADGAVAAAPRRGARGGMSSRADGGRRWGTTSAGTSAASI